MKKKYSLILDDEFIKYCELNNITDIESLAKQTFKRGFTILKYGETPSSIKTETQNEPKPEKIKEIIKPQMEQKPIKKLDIYGE
jgi:hypothetical protein